MYIKMSSTNLSAFNNQLISFLEDLSETYSEEADLKKAVDALKTLKRMNPRLIHSGFMEYVYPDFSEAVKTNDIDGLIAKAKTKLEGEFADISYAYWIFDKHWISMSQTNKTHIWDYCKVLVILAERAAA
jgi:hypothetical protein